MKRLHRRPTVAASIALAAAIAASTATAGVASAASAVPNGGTLKVLEVGTQWPGLDSGTDPQDAADNSFLNAIYGQLFELAPGNKVEPSQATGYKFSDDFKTVTITLRHGLKFSNGDPLTAADVAWSINRALDPKNANIGDVNFPVKGKVVATGKYAVVAHLSRPDSAFIDAFINEAPNWTVDHKALSAMGAPNYAQKPIGAGPFEVVSNKASTELVLKKNPNYWGAAQGLPHLSGLTFTAVGADQSAASALEAGQAQLSELMSTIPLLNSLPKDGLTVIRPPSTMTNFVALNEQTAPFNNIKAREAVAYATDSSALSAKLYFGAYPPVQDESAPGQHFYQQKDKYYPSYNLNKAKALVKQLGGLKVDLSTTTNTGYWTTEVEALSTMWEAAGIKVNIQDNTLQQMLQITFNKSWQAIDSNWGGNIDPSITDPQFFASTSSFSGVKDPNLDRMFNESASTANTATRAKIFQQINNRENQMVDAVWLYSKPFFDVATKQLVDNGGVGGKLDVIRWEDLAVKS